VTDFILLLLTAALLALFISVRASAGPATWPPATRRKDTMQKKLPGFNKVPVSTKNRPVKPFDPTRAAQTTARVSHTCDYCGTQIVPGDLYYQEGKGRFLGTLRGRKLCSRCYPDMAPEQLAPDE